MYKIINKYLIICLLRLFVILYRSFYLPIKVYTLRHKAVIKVAFLLSDLGKWKTETLYLRMKAHSRFDPSLIIIPYERHDNSGLTVLKEYLDDKGYPYYELGKEQKITDVVKTDILFYQEPYSGIINNNKRYRNNIRSLFCYVSYAFHTVDEDWFLNQPMQNFAWQVYFENALVKKSAENTMTNKGINCMVTGLPFTDLFMSLKENFDDPWKKNSTHKTRVIWAPHYTIDKYPLNYSTFMEYNDFMLHLADKYMNSIQIAFKPHPLLKNRLYEIWGMEKTDNYYSKWENGENTQLVLGDYVPLFMYSDAMIHDCGSFTVEYHYTRNPVMYLTKDEHHADGLNDFGKMAFDLHYKGRCEEDIEVFINDVIEGRDEMKEAREKFYNDYLLPPEGDSASDNIIKAILGE